MKKVMICALSAGLMLMTSCSKEHENDTELSVAVTPPEGMKDLTITFGFGDGDGGAARTRATLAEARTRATLSDASLTDLWVFDGSDMLLHQSATDNDFGAVRLSLKYGQHDLRFVASRGESPTVADGVISWAKTSDTFWASLPIDVSPSMSAGLQVTLRRVATRLRIAVTDEIPDNAATLTVTPDIWYYGLNVATGEGADGRKQARTIQIPASRIGTSGQFSASFFGLSPSTTWQTNVAVSMATADGTVLGSVTLPNVSLSQNVTTIYSGGLISGGRSLDVQVDDTWGEDSTNEW